MTADRAEGMAPGAGGATHAGAQPGAGVAASPADAAQATLAARPMARIDPAFWRGRRVLLTGHTGFKGAWLALMLRRLGAEVTGIALAPQPGPGLFTLLAPWDGLRHQRLDIRHAAAFGEAVRQARPQLVLHLAAETIVRRAYRAPAETFATNVQGTLHLLQALRGLPGVEAALVVTSDKVYRNQATRAGTPGFLESDPLGGEDPYSASKAACEIAVASWRASFAGELPPIATARAGNVIGGGDFGEARLLPDIARAQASGQPLLVRHPEATRPWQHVLDVLRGYLLLAQALAQRGDAADLPAALNFGPDAGGAASVREMVALWSQATGTAVPWEPAPGPHPPEAPHLALDASAARALLGWAPRRSLAESVAETARWYALWRSGADLRRASEDAVARELELA